MLTRRTLIGSSAAAVLSACGRTRLIGPGSDVALQKQPITIPAQGLDTHADPKSAQPGSFELLENVVGRRGTAGGVEWRKRPGTTSRTRNILGGGTISNGRKLAKFGNEQLTVTDTQLYSYDPVADKQVAKGYLTPAGLSTVRVASSINSSTRSMTTAATGGGYVCSISRIGATIRATVVNLTTGVAALTDYDVFHGANANGGHVIALASTFMILAMNNTGSTISAVTIDYIDPATPSAVASLVANASTTASRWDATRNGTADQVLVAYNGDAANRLRAIVVASNRTVASSLLFAEQPDRSICFLHHDYLDGKAWLAYVDSTRGAKTLPITIAGWAAGASTSVDAGVLTGRNITGFRSGGVNTTFVEQAGASTYLDTIIYQTGAGVYVTFQGGASLRSRVFKVGSTYYMTIAYLDGLQDKYFVVEPNLTAGARLTATAFDGLASPRPALDSWLSAVPAISSTVVAVPVEVFETTVGVTGSTSSEDVYGAVYLRLDFAPTVSSPKQIGQVLVFPGAILREYDGNTTTEQGFPVAPVLYNPTQTAGIGGIAIGTYSFKAIYRYVDGKGQDHKSATSATFSVTVTGAASQVSIDATNLRLGDKGTKAVVEFYVTLVGGTTYFAAVGVTAVGTDKTTITIFSIDSGNVGDELYTTGRVLPHNSPPPANLIEVWGDRAFLAQTDEPNQLWASVEIEEGLGLAFSQVNVTTLPSEDGEVTSLDEFDDRVLIGKASSLYQLSGSGPAENGDGQYQQPARIDKTEGSISQNGVAKTKAGIIFKSAHGMYLLPRGGADPVRLGKVEGYDSLTITGASNVPGDASTGGFEQTRLVSSAGTTLVYHYGLTDEAGLGRWSTFTGQAAVDCANFGGAWCYLSSDGTVHIEVAGQYADDGVAYQRRERFNWISAAGLFGRMRLYGLEILGDVLSSCTINGSLAYDFDPAVIDAQTKVVTVATLGVMELEPSIERSDAVQITLSETSTGEGYRLSALGLEIGVKMGFGKQAIDAFFQ